ncbi:MAG TPA: response regulator [Candidatus Polarisedimenticolia bacterium]|nr:response regulator [Candidatus Polarisedimenticolia bacterium]
MKRILFVDDEPLVLEGLRSALREQRSNWHITFATSGQEALTALRANPYDVIVSDIRMPGIDGAALLRKVQDEHPDVVRIVLSGQGEEGAARRTVQIAHQFLAKPCEASLLQEVIERACALRSLLNDEGLRHAIGQVGQLPVLPAVYKALTRALEDPAVSLRDMGAIVEQDSALCAKLLQMVNSAFFGLPQRINRIEDAVSYLGTDVIKGLVLMTEVFREAHIQRLPASSLEDLQHHAALTARIARRLLPEREQQQEAFIAGMLHDVGKLVLASRLPEQFARLFTEARDAGLPMHAVEHGKGVVTHAEIGAYLLGLWGLPYTIVEAVAHHHAPTRVAQRSFGVLGAVYVGNLLAHEQEGAGSGGKVVPHDPIDESYLASVGAEDELPAWREIAVEVAAEMIGI